MLVFFLEDAAKNDWLGYANREAYLRDGLELDPTMAEWAVDGLRRLDGNQAMPFNEAVVLGKRGAPKGNANAAKERENKGNNITFVDRGTSASYTQARLKRDRPDLAEKVVAGELSPNKAAIEAGFRRKPLTLSSDADKAAQAVIEARGLAWADELVAALLVHREAAR